MPSDTGIDMTPLLFGLVFVAVTIARSVWLRRVAGVNAYVIDHRDPTHRFVAHVFFAVVVGLVLYFSTIALAPDIAGDAGLIAWAANGFVQWVGVVLMAVATIWTGYAQFAMGSSWRIGIPDDAPPLCTDGPFALSRNPIFLGMLAFVAGMTLWSPSAVTVSLLVAAYIAIAIQIRGEEGFLERMHGEAYRAYQARVRRWI
jgi:protein-S-isoprenylcysteine O-methyltransferase Ste14